MEGVMRPKVLTVVALALPMVLISSQEIFAQASRVPASLDMLPAALETSRGAALPVTIRLRNFREETVTTPQRVDVTIKSDLLKHPAAVTIPAGKDSGRTNLVFERSGVAS